MLKFIDGFDHYNPTNNANNTKWFQPAFTAWATGRNVSFPHNKAANLYAGGATMLTGEVTGDNSQYVGVALNWNGSSGLYKVQFGLNSSGTNRGACYFTVTNAGAIAFYYTTSSGDVFVNATSAGVVQPNNWYYVEVGVVLSGVWNAMGGIYPQDGSASVQVNGVLLATWSGVFTRYQDLGSHTDPASTTASTYYGITLFGGDNLVDDFYNLNGLSEGGGHPNNSFLGDMAVVTLMPNAAGASTALSPTNPTNVNYSNAANIAPNTAEFNSSGTPGDTDLYKFEDLPLVAAIYGVQVTNNATASASGTIGISQKAYRSGTQYEKADPIKGTSLVSTPTYVFDSAMFSVDPQTSAPWTRTNLNDHANTQFGVVVKPS